MRTTPLITSALAVVATIVPLGMNGAAQADEPTTTITHERGVLVECSGTIRDRAVFASLYENRTFGNEIQVLIGDDDGQVGGNRRDPDGFVDGRRVRGSMKVGSDRAVIAGTAPRTDVVVPVDEVYDDAGMRITTTGRHRLLDADLTLNWRHRTVPLDCETAFRYALTVTKEPII